MIIGCDVPEAHWHEDEPYAAKSLLGWSIIGLTAPLRRDQGSVNFTQGSDALLCEQMGRLLESDFNDHLQGKSMTEDKRALKLFHEKVQETEEEKPIHVEERDVDEHDESLHDLDDEIEKIMRSIMNDDDDGDDNGFDEEFRRQR